MRKSLFFVRPKNPWKEQGDFPGKRWIRNPQGEKPAPRADMGHAGDPYLEPQEGLMQEVRHLGGGRALVSRQEPSFHAVHGPAGRLREDPRMVGGGEAFPGPLGNGQGGLEERGGLGLERRDAASSIATGIDEITRIKGIST